jgi:hypothetical protein
MKLSSGSTIEGVSAIVGEVGIGMDSINMLSTTEIMQSGTELFSKYSTVLSVGLDSYQALTSTNPEDTAFHTVDAIVDLGVSRLGYYGVAVSIAYTAVGGARGLATQPNPNPNYVFPY